MYNRGNGYEEHERGRFESALTWNGEEIARTSGELIIAYSEYSPAHDEEVKAWANEYGFEIEWR